MVENNVRIVKEKIEKFVSLHEMGLFLKIAFVLSLEQELSTLNRKHIYM